MSPINEDNYREVISENDQEKDFVDFSTIAKPEEVLPLEEELVSPKENVPLEDNFSSIKESTMKEPEEISQQVGAFPYIEIKEQEEEPVIEEPIIEEEPVIEEKLVEEESVQVKKVTPVVEESNPLKRTIQITEQEEEPVVEEPIIKEPIANPIIVEEPVIEEKSVPVKPPIIESYKKIRDEFWEQVNPSNRNRFKDSGLEENEENRAFLNDLSVKITFLDDDLEDKVISEIEAVFKIKEIKKLLD